MISIESELSVREADLESLQQQQAALTGQVALSTISLTLTAVTDTPATEPAPQDNGFVAGIKSGWAALLGFFGWIGGAVGALLPFLPFLAAAGLIGWWLVRRLRRRRSRSAAPQPPVGTPTPVPAGPAHRRMPQPTSRWAPDPAAADQSRTRTVPPGVIPSPTRCARRSCGTIPP